MKVMENQYSSRTKLFSEDKLLNECRSYFSSETEKTAEIGEKFIHYFLKNASPEGVLFKTIKDITTDINISHQTLTKVLKTLESKEIIYRRNGIIGLWKE
ncbi:MULTISPECIES: replication/maintenance protein RepL [Planococcus]|uniref:Replication/maintenance protein RepL n=1 Tax=Planococcus wigleyi TaxID=2762216 RepID=A0ABR8W983_9BACL|nr:MULTISPECIES: replication/maintenance protein RepL [Planococcus]MBD8013572.1 replication/maintenance protein RepL [Planococcus wigleyi]MBF6633412.1 replication/maintenance protein RepL [Planococcus sp. (in: firmicutes)]MDN3437468.1 replication/maintenance protein RepL [Planococcus sp. APC 3900]